MTNKEGHSVPERCYICGSKIGRGNLPHIPPHERMNKLVSVRQTAEHRTTTISETLTRVLDEAVAREEAVCRICFNLLNDIDYHLREAQDKTDEITTKFLDKSDPIAVKPKFWTSKSHTASLYIEEEEGEREEDEEQEGDVRPYQEAEDRRAKKERRAKGQGDGDERKRGYRPRKGVSQVQSPSAPVPRMSATAVPLPPSSAQAATDTETEGPMTEDEMSVNTINRNKAKLLSHVLNPRKTASATAAASSSSSQSLQHSSSAVVFEAEEESREEEEEKQLRVHKRQRQQAEVETEGEEEEEVRYEKKAKRRRRTSTAEGGGGKRGSKKRRRSEKQQAAAADADADGEEDEDDAEDERENRPVKSEGSRGKSSTKKRTPAGDQLVTVNMDDLGDLLSKAPKTAYFARKSEPAAGRKRKAKVDEVVMEEFREKDGSPSSDKPQCPYCGKVFKRTTNLCLHLERVHNEVVSPAAQPGEVTLETHRCNMCPREFTNAKSLSTHKEDHRREDEENAKKRSADPSSSSSPPAKVVWSSSSPGAKASPSKKKSQPPENNKPPAKGDEAKAVCPHCNKTFRRHFNMRIHVDRVHNKVKPFPCKFCDKAFATNSDLKQHIGVHGEGQRFECEVCGRTFNNRDSIILHRKQHTNSRTHFCVVCNKGFFKASCLNRHVRSHTGERPYHCDACGKGFSQSTTLKAHKAKCPRIRDAEGGREGEESREFVSVN